MAIPRRPWSPGAFERCDSPAPSRVATHGFGFWDDCKPGTTLSLCLASLQGYSANHKLLPLCSGHRCRTGSLLKSSEDCSASENLDHVDSLSTSIFLHVPNILLALATKPRSPPSSALQRDTWDKSRRLESSCKAVGHVGHAGFHAATRERETRRPEELYIIGYLRP